MYRLQPTRGVTVLSEPLAVEVNLRAPLDDVFATFVDDKEPVFLDSSLTHAHLGRYSYLAADPFLVLSCRDGDVRLRAPSSHAATAAAMGNLLDGLDGDPFGALQALLRRFRTRRRPDLPPFQGGAVGYFAYDLGRYVESLPRVAADDLALPELRVGLYAWVLAHDHVLGRTWLLYNPFGEGQDVVGERLRAIARRVEGARSGDGESSLAPPTGGLPPSVRLNYRRADYLAAIRAAKAYIAEGDIYEVCLSQRLEAEIDVGPWDLYRRLRAVSPVPYGAYLGFEQAAIASVSPEMFLRLSGKGVETRPIKGTRPRGTTREADEALAADLMGCEKDRAENLMIVDLLRNDLGRACRAGSVTAPSLFALESYSTVHHLVSVVRGQLRPELDAVDLLRACFPGGSVTGCPKIRSMEIIDELEPTRRGPYCGAIGFLGFNGDMDTSIAIRTAIVRGRRAYYQVGGAIVADSDPDAEYAETLDKARAFLLATGGSIADGG